MMTEKALTLEQLQKMRGKWVWIVSPDKDLTVSGWAYVGKDHVYTYWEYERDELVGRVVYNICDYGAWLAYKNPTAINLEALPVVQQLREENARLNRGISDLAENVKSAYEQRDKIQKELARVTAERNAAEKDRAALANLELALCEEFCFGDMRSGIPPCEWYEDGACKLRKWRDKHAEAD